MQDSLRTMSVDSVAAEQQRFMVRVYNWMTAGLAITGFMAFYISSSPTMMNIIFGNPIMPIVLIIVQIGLVFWLATRVMQMSVSQATGVFMLYAGLTHELVDMAHERLTIPMDQEVESLNVAVSGSLLAYEAKRQKSHQSSS